MRKMDNDISHEFDLLMFLTVRDILSDRQFIFSDTSTILFMELIWGENIGGF